MHVFFIHTSHAHTHVFLFALLCAFLTPCQYVAKHLYINSKPSTHNVILVVHNETEGCLFYLQASSL